MQYAHSTLQGTMSDWLLGYLELKTRPLCTFNITQGQTCGRKQLPTQTAGGIGDNLVGGSYGYIRVLIEYIALASSLMQYKWWLANRLPFNCSCLYTQSKTCNEWGTYKIIWIDISSLCHHPTCEPWPSHPRRIVIQTFHPPCVRVWEWLWQLERRALVTDPKMTSLHFQFTLARHLLANNHPHSDCWRH